MAAAAANSGSFLTTYFQMVKEKTSFDTMKDTQKPVSGEKVQGKVGSHQTMLSEKQVTCIDDKTRETLANFASVSDYSLAAI